MSAEWAYYYQTEGHVTKENNPSMPQLTQPDNSYLIWLCSFIHLNNNGAVRFTNTVNTKKALVEFTIFDSCSSVVQKNNGGSLYYKKGECIQAFNCYYNSSTLNNNGMAYYIELESQNQNYRSLTNSTSLSECKGDKDNSYCSIDHEGGKVRTNEMNISYCVCHAMVIFSIHYAANDPVINYMTATNNSIDTTISSFAFSYQTEGTHINNCNFLNNYCYTGLSDLFIWSEGNSFIEGCCFKRIPCRSYVRGEFEKLTTISNCYFDEYTHDERGSYLYIDNKTDSETLSISHLSLGKCLAYRYYPETQQFKNNVRFMRFKSDFEIFLKF